MQNSYHILIDQIDAFIKKYYKNQLLKGGLLFVLLCLLVFILTSSLEFFGRFPVLVRGVLFFGFIVLQSYLFIRFIGIPLSRLWAFGKRISHIQAAEIIGVFFPDVADKLKNTIQLQQDLDGNIGNIDNKDMNNIINTMVNQMGADPKQKKNIKKQMENLVDKMKTI